MHDRTNILTKPLPLPTYNEDSLPSAEDYPDSIAILGDRLVISRQDAWYWVDDLTIAASTWRDPLASTAINATRLALRDQILARGGMPASMASPPTISSSTTSTLSGTHVRETNAAIAYWGPEYGQAGPSYPFSEFYRFFNLTRTSGDRQNGPGGMILFRATGARFEVCVRGGGATNSRFRIYVDGEVAGISPDLPADGGFHFVKVDLGSSASRNVRLEVNGELYFGGVKLDTGGALAASTEASKGLVLSMPGDSFTEGTGATNAFDGLAVRTAKHLGFLAMSISGFGGTGWLRDLAASNRPALPARLQSDVIAISPDVVIIPMGLNDEILVGDGAALQPVIEDAVDDIWAAKPSTLIYLVGPWNPNAPGLDGNRLMVRNAIRDAALARPGTRFLDLTGIAFTKSDATHPDQPGHVTLSDSGLVPAIKADLGIV